MYSAIYIYSESYMILRFPQNMDRDGKVLAPVFAQNLTVLLKVAEPDEHAVSPGLSTPDNHIGPPGFAGDISL